jgi:hypothetical protein
MWVASPQSFFWGGGVGWGGVSKAKMIGKKNGTFLKIDNLNFEHLH